MRQPGQAWHRRLPGIGATAYFPDVNRCGKGEEQLADRLEEAPFERFVKLDLLNSHGYLGTSSAWGPTAKVCKYESLKHAITKSLFPRSNFKLSNFEGVEYCLLPKWP